jgi:hypothetical protein
MVSSENQGERPLGLRLEFVVALTSSASGAGGKPEILNRHERIPDCRSTSRRRLLATGCDAGAQNKQTRVTE